MDIGTIDRTLPDKLTWDNVFASQYDSVITNPPDDPVPDPDYVIPS